LHSKRHDPRARPLDDLIEIEGNPFNAVLAFIRNTHVTGVIDAPAVSVPAELTQRGLPVGLELDGLPGQDESLLRSALPSSTRSSPCRRRARSRQHERFGRALTDAGLPSLQCAGSASDRSGSTPSNGPPSMSSTFTMLAVSQRCVGPAHGH
jgi:hypothetical protein